MTDIMIIDDDELFVRTMEIALESRGFKVISAHGGVEGLNMLKTTKPDLVLLDIMMPGVDGWKTLRGIKGNEALATVPVIMLSAKHPKLGMPRKKGGTLGFADYITKPFDIDDLHSRVTKALHS